MIEVIQFLARQSSAPVRRRKSCVALRPEARQGGSLPGPSPHTLDVDIHMEYADLARSQRVKQNGAVPRRSLVKSTLLARLHFEISRSALLPGASIEGASCPSYFATQSDAEASTPRVRRLRRQCDTDWSPVRLRRQT